MHLYNKSTFKRQLMIIKTVENEENKFKLQIFIKLGI